MDVLLSSNGRSGCGGYNDMVLMSKKYLPLYYKWMKTGRLPDPGLCFCLGEPLDLELFMPEDAPMFSYWANRGNLYSERQAYKFNLQRQNIVLFLAAMNNEL